NQLMERKDFFKVIGGGIATGTLIAYLESCKKSSDNNPSSTAPSVDFTLDLSSSSNSALLTSGGSVISNQVLVINNGGTYVAVSDICTHASCSVNYNKSSNNINCPCHGSVFAVNGTVINGPASSPLKQYNVSKNGN